MSLRSLVERKYMVANFSNETYWSCFAYEDEVPDDLHCTHKFFGEQTDMRAEDIKHRINAWFEDNPFVPFTVRFDTEQLFGENKDVRVLTPSEKPDMSLFLMGLRRQLDEYAPDNHPIYKPHVTTDAPSIEMPFTRYCFCQGDRIIAQW